MSSAEGHDPPRAELPSRGCWLNVKDRLAQKLGPPRTLAPPAGLKNWAERPDPYLVRLVSYRVALLVVLGGVLATGPGCAPEDAARSGTRVMHVSERDFRIAAPKRLGAGTVDL